MSTDWIDDAITRYKEKQKQDKKCAEETLARVQRSPPAFSSLRKAIRAAVDRINQGMGQRLVVSGDDTSNTMSVRSPKNVGVEIEFNEAAATVTTHAPRGFMVDGAKAQAPFEGSYQLQVDGASATWSRDSAPLPETEVVQRVLSPVVDALIDGK